MQRHNFHLVDPSPWPLCASISLWGFTSGLIGYFHDFKYSSILILLSFIGILYVGFIWFRDIVRESVFLGHHSKAVQTGIFYGMVLFIISEVMLFMGFFWAFAHSALAPTIDVGGVWPPIGIQPLNAFEIPLLNTVILLTSGASITYCHYAILIGKNDISIKSLAITIFLAIIFTGLQTFEYLTADFCISDSIYGSCFYMLTGLHGLHVIIGTIFLAITLIRIILGQLRQDHHLGFELAALYWHFVDVVWLIVFIVVYYWGS